MNEPELKAYMNRYPDVKKDYAHYKGAEFVKKVNEQWNTVGKKENRKHQNNHPIYQYAVFVRAGFEFRTPSR